MGNNQNKLRKSQSLLDTQTLSSNAHSVHEKSRSSQRLVDNSQPADGWHKGIPGSKKIAVTEACFLPHFPLRGEIEDQNFQVVEVLAQGAFGNVLKVQREDDKKFYAMKVLDKQQIIRENAIMQCKDEATIQQTAGDHPFIVKAFEYWQSRRSLYIVLEYVQFGELFTLWNFHGAFPEQLVKIYIAEMAMVIDYLHNNGIIYRDVKMENILLDHTAPEVLSVYPYGHAADWWSLGILMYVMLVGQYPVEAHANHTNMATKVFECDYLLPGDFRKDVQEVMHQLLTKNAQRRLSDLPALQDLQFFRDVVFSDFLENKVSPMAVVSDDFFTMSGRSWVPRLMETCQADDCDGGAPKPYGFAWGSYGFHENC